MKLNVNLGAVRTAGQLLALFAIAFSASVATGQPNLFDETFDDDPFTRDINWGIGNTQYLDGHPLQDDIKGTYDMTTGGQGVPGSLKLQYNTTSGGNELGDYTNEIEVALDTFVLTDPPGTQSDFKWKTFGPDGFTEVVLNSFGNMRFFHRNTAVDPPEFGNLVLNFPTGYVEEDNLKLTQAYHKETDTIHVSFALNGGPATTLYSGTGNGGAFGDVITNFLEVELFKWGGDLPDDNMTAKIDRWSLTDTITIPELTGDYNDSGQVEQSDLDLVLLNWGDPHDPAPEGWINDLPTPENIDQDELDGVLLNWGNTAATAAAAAVPEPSTLALLGLGCLAMLIRRRRT